MLWIKDKLSDEKIILNYLDLLEYHKQKLFEIDKIISDTAYANNNAKLLMTIPGIASVRALDLAAEIGEISRFPTAEKLCSYSGLVPSVHQSGNTLRFGNLIKQASKNLKYTLIETCWTLAQSKESNSLQEFYKKLAKKKGKQKAICATARKLCCVIHAMLKNQEEFRYS